MQGRKKNRNMKKTEMMCGDTEERCSTMNCKNKQSLKLEKEETWKTKDVIIYTSFVWRKLSEKKEDEDKPFKSKTLDGMMESKQNKSQNKERKVKEAP